MSLVDDYLQSFLAASLGERLALVALVLALAIVLRQVLRARQPDTPAPALAALGERLEMTTRRAEAAEDEARQLGGADLGQQVFSWPEQRRYCRAGCGCAGRSAAPDLGANAGF